MNIQGSGTRIITSLKFLVPTLANSERKAAEYLLEDPGRVCGQSIVEFAEQSGSSQAAVIRLCKRIDLSGFAQLKVLLEQQLNSGEVSAHDLLNTASIDPSMEIAPCIRDAFEMNIQILKETYELAGDDYQKAFEAMLGAKQIAFFGIGDAMIPCLSAHIKFRRLGYICFADVDADMQIVDAMSLSKGDIAIAVSHSGNTRHVVAAMKVAKRRGAVTIAITKLDKSPLLKYCDIKLFTATADITPGKEIVARRVAEQAILESLYLGLMKRQEEAARKRNRELSQEMKANKLRST